MVPGRIQNLLLDSPLVMNGLWGPNIKPHGDFHAKVAHAAKGGGPLVSSRCKASSLLVWCASLSICQTWLRQSICVAEGFDRFREPSIFPDMQIFLSLFSKFLVFVMLQN